VAGISKADTGEETQDPLLIEETQTPAAYRRVGGPSRATLPGQAEQMRFSHRFGAAATRIKANTTLAKRSIFDELRSVSAHRPAGAVLGRVRPLPRQCRCRWFGVSARWPGGFATPVLHPETI
jgi:hypothetical protein